MTRTVHSRRAVSRTRPFVPRSLPLLVALCVLAGLSAPTSVRADNNPAPPSTPINDVWGHDQFLAKLTSGDAAQVAQTLRDIETRAKKTAPYRYRGTILQVLVDVKRYTEADAMAVRLILFDPFHSDSVAALEKLRAKALLAQNKPAEALAAAKAYYNTALLKDTADAIDTVALCLIRATPDEPGIGRRFKRQQVAGSQAPSTTQPAASDDLGPPILPAIKVDPAPFEQAIAAMPPSQDFKSLVMKGNLLLAADKTKEARTVFEEAYLVVPPERAGDAVENIARAIRADAACIGPANAYIQSERNASGDTGKP